MQKVTSYSRREESGALTECEYFYIPEKKAFIRKENGKVLGAIGGEPHYFSVFNIPPPHDRMAKPSFEIATFAQRIRNA